MADDTPSPEAQASDRQAKLDALHEQLTDAVQALVTGEDWQRAITFAAKFRRYSFGNVLLLFQQGMVAYEAGLLPHPYLEYVAGYKAWQALGRQVRAGTRGFQILAPKTSRVAVASDGTYRRLDRGEKPGPGETVSTRMTGVRPTTVFPVEFTDGDPIPERPAPLLLEGQAPPGLYDGVTRIIESKGFTVHDAPDAASLGGANGVTRWTDKTVHVRADMEPVQRCKTLLHEAGHVLLHARDDADAAVHRGIAEVEAESVALMVAASHYGMDTSDYTIPYVSTWASRVEGQDPVVTVQQTAARVRTAALQILAGLDTQQVPDGDPPVLARSGVEAAATGRATPDRTAQTVPSDDGLARLDLRGRHHAHPGSAVLAEGVGR